MTRLIVDPIDPSAKGSWRLHRKLLGASKAISEIQEQTKKLGPQADDSVATLAALEVIYDLVVSRLSTEDGSPVDDALDDISVDDFQLLITAISGETVPTTSSKP